MCLEEINKNKNAQVFEKTIVKGWGKKDLEQLNGCHPSDYPNVVICTKHIQKSDWQVFGIPVKGHHRKS